MRVTQILTKTQVYEHEHPAYANAPLATYMHTYSLSLSLSVCLSLSHLLASKAACCNAPPIRSSLFAHITNSDVRRYHVTRACLQAYTNPCTHATSTMPAPVIDTIHASAATRAQRGLKPILQQLEPPFHATPSRPAHTRAHTHFSNRRHGTCKHRGHSTQE